MATAWSLILVATTILCHVMLTSSLIVRGPASVAVDVGGSIKLQCQVAERGSHPVRWFRVDTRTVISSNEKIYKRAPRKRYKIVGNQTVGEFHLLIRNINLVDNGTYACGILSDMINPLFMSDPADLLVVQEPLCTTTSTAPPSPGVSITMSCQSRNAGLDVDLSWGRLSQPNVVLHSSDQTNSSSDIHKHILDIRLSATDIGESFVCRERFVEPDFTRTCTLTPIQTHLNVILFPKHMESVQGQNGTFNCIITSKNDLMYEWYINGARDFSVIGSKYVFSPVTVRHNNTEIECRVRDTVTEMMGNATSIMYVYPVSVSSMTTSSVDEDNSRHTHGPLANTVQTTSDIGRNPSRPSNLHQTSMTLPQTTSVKVSPTTPDANSNPPVNIMNAPQNVPGLGNDDRWDDMIVPILVVGSIIAVLLICVIVVLILFLVRQNRVGHGSVHGKEEPRKLDVPLNEVRVSDSTRSAHQGEVVNEEEIEFGGEDELVPPKYFTLEPGKRKVRRLERTTSHVILSDNSQYNVLSKNSSLRLPSEVKLNDYAGPGSQMSAFDGDISTVSAYAVTDVTLNRGATSLKRSRSCIRPLPAAPGDAIMNRSHYSIPREACGKPQFPSESSGDSETARWGIGLSDSIAASNRRSLCVRPYVPTGDEYAEIDSPPRPASPVSTDYSRPSSPELPRGTRQNIHAMKDLTSSLAGSYESGYDAASSDDVMDCESMSQYATIDSYLHNKPVIVKVVVSSPLSQDKNEESSEKVTNTKEMPVYAKVKRTKGTQVEDANIDDYQEELTEAVC